MISIFSEVLEHSSEIIKRSYYMKNVYESEVKVSEKLLLNKKKDLQDEIRFFSILQV